MSDRYDEIIAAVNDLTKVVTEQNLAVAKLEVQMSIIKWAGGLTGGAIILFLLGKVSSAVF